MADSRTQRGFSLLELMIVMCIVAILMTAGAFTTKRMRDQARLAVFETDVSMIRQAAIRYHQDCGFLPSDVGRGVDPGMASEYGWSLGEHSAEWENLTCDRWRGPYLRVWPHNPWGGLYDWDNFQSSYPAWGISGPGAYLTMHSSDWGGVNGMPSPEFEQMVGAKGLDGAAATGIISVYIAKNLSTQPAQ